MALRTALMVAAVAAASTATSCELPPPSASKSGPVVIGSSNTRSTYYAECAEPDRKAYRVKISAAAARTLRDGQPCPAGVRESLPKDAHPELYRELQKRLPYGGGNPSCGEWQTIDKTEARQMAKKCPPWKWGNS